MKVALCFNISYNHNVNKEELWKEWISQNQDLFNIYFHYKDATKIKSQWIKKHALPQKYVLPTDYLHCVPAYFALMYYALEHDKTNEWFCFLTESCVPIISPLKFRHLFLTNYYNTIMKIQPIWWNIHYCNRANLKYLPQDFHLANSPWFVLSRQDAHQCIKYSQKYNKEYKFICNGDVANESIFAIILSKYGGRLHNIRNENTTITDWSRMTSATSPYLFKTVTPVDKTFIQTYLKENRYSMFLRKVGSEYPDDILKELIYFNHYDHDDNISLNYMFYLEICYFCKKMFQRVSFFKYVFCMFVALFMGLTIFILSHLDLAFPTITTFNATDESCHGFIC